MKDKILTALFYPFAFVIVWNAALKSIFKNMRFFSEYHTNLSEEERHNRIVENVINDLKKFKREHGIVDRPSE